MSVAWYPPNPAAVKRQLQGAPVNVLYCGAVGDGVADDTAAIQAAIDSWGANGGPVFLPPGKYKITASLVLKATSSLIGSGGSITSVRSATIIDATSIAAATALNVTNTNYAGVTLRNFSLYGPSNPVSALSQGIVVGYAATTMLESVSVLGFYTGIHLANTSSTMLVNCDVQGAKSVGVDIEGSSTTAILGGSYANTTGQGMAGAANLRIRGGSKDVDIFKPTMDEAFSTGGGSKSIEILDATNVHLAGMRIYAPVNGYGIMLGDGAGGHNPARVRISDLRIEPFNPALTPQTQTIWVQAGSTEVSLMNVSTNANGGGDILDSGTGTVFFNVNGAYKLALPTSNPGAGLLWSDGGTVKVGT